ncbi:MAG: hypothetical protein KF819_03065 [Labilithrix sp.]|nr:hypothetical protein [Labilithrix sp.]
MTRSQGPWGRRKTLLALAGAAIFAGIAACVLNPQPLPPNDDENNRASDGNQEGAPSAVNADAADPRVPEPSDSGAGTGDIDADDAGDAGASDASDAG